MNVVVPIKSGPGVVGVAHRIVAYDRSTERTAFEQNVPQFLDSLAQKVANAGAVMIAYPLLALIGFVPALGLHNSAAAITGLQWCFLLGPIFFVALGGVCCIGWKLDATRHAQIRVALEERDAVLLTAAAETPFG